MILRKPYAFLIKHFRLIHFVLALLACYSIYRTKILLDFFNNYIFDMINIMGQDLAPSLIPWFYKFVPILIIVVTMILLAVMSFKKKPRMFYVFNILIYIFVLVIIFVANSTLDSLYRTLLDARTIRLVRDFVMLSYMAQFITLPVVVIRTIGFDIKKFNFGEDLKDLEISEEDREEFELQFSFDKNEFSRKIRRFKRFFKYSYKEHLILYNAIGLLILSLAGGAVGIHFMLKTPTVQQGSTVTANGLTMNILNSYITNTDYKGNIIDDENYYLILRINIKSNSAETALDTATAKVMVGSYYYLHTLKHKDSFTDFGEIYTGEKIGNKYEEKVLVYEIPKKIINNDIVFSFVNRGGNVLKDGFKSTNVKINYQSLIGIHSSETFLMGQDIDFSDTILKDYQLLITKIDFSDVYKIKYNYCISKECYPSYEYLKPNLNTNYDKTLLKITGKLIKTRTVQGVYDVYDFVEHFGKICYNINGTIRTYSLNANEIISSKTAKTDNYYIEVPSTIKDADSISIVFTVRDKIYEYTLK